MSKVFHHPETILLHGGQEPDPTTGSRAVPIYQTTSYVFRDTEHAQNLFSLEESGHIYTRIGNPTVDAFEQRVALLENGVGAVATSSGMAAIALAILNLAGAGDEIIADSNLYGGTYNLFANTLPRYGISVTFVDGTDLEAIRDAITPKTKAIFGETITNPSLHVFDIERVAAIAHQHHIPLIIDNTFAPYMAKPLVFGADIVVHSATKWIGGHGTTIGGIIVDGGRFDWNPEKFPAFHEPDDSYHGLRYADLGPQAYSIKLRVQLLRDLGACLSPQDAFLLLQGLETLHLRIERHNQNALEIAKFLKQHPSVEWVNYPGLQEHPSYPLAKKYFKHGFGSVVTFGIKGGREAGRKLIDHVNLWSHVANVGDSKSLIIHPASTTHQQLDADALKRSGVSEELIRLSVGTEATTDILLDLDQAIAKATNTQPLLQQSEEDAIRWLLHSPFNREEKSLRRKVIAVITSDEKETAFSHQLDQLQELGFQIVPIRDTSDGKSYHQLAEIPFDVDAVLIRNQSLPATIIEQLINKKGKIIWIENWVAKEPLLDHAQAAGIAVITNRCLYEEALRIRNNLADPVHTTL